jgi:predicted permease
MEFARADGRSLIDTARAVAAAMFRNALMIGLAIGLGVNLSGLPVPDVVRGAVDLVADSALPAALFGLGGILTRYALRASLGEESLISVLSLVVHPAITLGLAAGVFALSPDFVRSAVVTAAMAPGVNAYVFASLYNRGQAEAASVVLLATAMSVLTVSGWLAVLAALD